MRIAAAVLGIVGGLMGITFAQLVMYATAIFGLLAAAFGSTAAGQPLAWSLVALVAYAVGVGGGAVALSRPRPAAVLLLLAAAGGLGATLASGTSTAAVLSPKASPQPTATLGPVRTVAPVRTVTPTASPAGTPGPAAPFETYVITAAPFSGPALLVLAAILAFLAPPVRTADLTPTGGRVFTPADRSSRVPRDDLGRPI